MHNPIRGGAYSSKKERCLLIGSPIKPWRSVSYESLADDFDPFQKKHAQVKTTLDAEVAAAVDTAGHTGPFKGSTRAPINGILQLYDPPKTIKNHLI